MDAPMKSWNWREQTYIDRERHDAALGGLQNESTSSAGVSLSPVFLGSAISSNPLLVDIAGRDRSRF
jgi:hypothetical protein